MQNKKRWCSFGDSITYQNLWQPYVADACGLEHINCGLGSTTIAVPARPLENWAMHTDQRLGRGAYARSLTARSPAGVEFHPVLPNQPDVVTIMGGANDLLYSAEIGMKTELNKILGMKKLSTFIGAYSYIIETLLAWRPSLEIVIVSLLPLLNAPPYRGFTQGECFQATKTVAEYYALPFVDLYHTCGFNRLTKDAFMPDGVHPNARGAERMGAIIAKAMCGISREDHCE